MQHSFLSPLLLFLLFLSFRATATAQDREPPRWNGPAALDLVERGRTHRQRAPGRSFRAEARGHLYFLVDRPDRGQRTLVRADQLAVELFQDAAGRTRQRIVGRRGEERLPTDIRYHLDHLTVVTDDFGDRIVIGDGDEVRSVPHPFAPGSGEHYDFRLGDSLTVQLPGGRDPVRAREVEVRPVRSDRPGFVGTVLVDRATGGIVRMDFTFTSASYVDSTVDHIRVSLRNARWENGLWLPYRQEIELRRELTFLDLSTGSVILGRYEIGDYRFDPDLPEGFFAGPPVSVVPADRLASFPFERDLYAELEDEGRAPGPELREARRRASRLVAERYLSGVAALRPAVPSLSSVLRHNRAEGTYVGAGASYRRGGLPQVRVGAGYAFGRERPAASMTISTDEAAPGFRAEAYWNELRDLGPEPGASGATSSLATLLGEADYLDPYFATGARLEYRLAGEGESGVRVGLRAERHDAARFVLSGDASDDLRPVLPVDEGTDLAFRVRATVEPAEGWSAEGGLTLGRFDGRGYVAGDASVEWSRRWLTADVAISTGIQGGFVGSGAPLQSLHHLGGRSTLPGYRYRSHVGDRYWLARTEASWGGPAPWLRPRIFGSVGHAELDDHRVPDSWPRTGTPIPLFSAGAGVGLFWDVIRVDAGRGLNGGGWEWIVSVNPSFHPIL